MMKDPKKAFSDRVNDYKKFRPTYPIEAIIFVKNSLRVEDDWTIADVGSGTGISTDILLKVFGC